MSYIGWFHLCEIPRIGKSVEAEIRFVAARAGGKGAKEQLLNGNGVSFWRDENISERDGGGGCITLWMY